MAKDKEYSSLLSGVSQIINEARGATVKTVNSIMTATYWEIGRMIVENEQKGKKRAEYGEELLKVLSADLRQQFGRGFGVDNLQRMRLFYQLYSPEKISATLSHISEIEDVTLKYATPSRKSQKSQTPSAEFSFTDLGLCFPLPG